MDVREKLVELLGKAKNEFWCSREKHNGTEFVADYLIARGVTVQEWISVNDPPGKKGCYLVAVKHWCDGKPVTREAYYTISGWISCEKGVDITSRVTHWQYLPQPPKGE